MDGIVPLKKFCHNQANEKVSGRFAFWKES